MLLNRIIIGVAGRIGTGKSYVINMLTFYVESRGHEVKIVFLMKGVEDALKAFVDNREFIYDKFKDKVMYNNFWRDLYERLEHIFIDLYEKYHDKNFSYYWRKKMMQDISIVGRKMETKYWLNQLDLTGLYDVCFIDDVKFLNEYKFLKDKGGYIIRVDSPMELVLKRTGLTESEYTDLLSHVSENEIDLMSFDKIYHNKGDIYYANTAQT